MGFCRYPTYRYLPLQAEGALNCIEGTAAARYVRSSLIQLPDIIVGDSFTALLGCTAQVVQQGRPCLLSSGVRNRGQCLRFSHIRSQLLATRRRRRGVVGGHCSGRAVPRALTSATQRRDHCLVVGGPFHSAGHAVGDSGRCVRSVVVVVLLVEEVVEHPAIAAAETITASTAMRFISLNPFIWAGTGIPKDTSTPGRPQFG